ncbi:hypothetical protein BDV59DRAFT_169423 [Aspergillus ambiguus]|uniref:uncharacterized protein n=1 Tax=Aspergillus ambiguus TaxID=176160 RepID=UPI003CCD58DB
MGKTYHDNLSNDTYVEEDCRLAIQGQQIPSGLGEKYITQLCVVRGIRYHPGFATDLRGVLPKFTRALNAREIMSNKIPEMKTPEDFPYCIWYPECATETTYRALAAKYPQMRYQVGRACAVAGYVDLFNELDLLPECHIAEEARDNEQWKIYNAVMQSDSVRYNAMDDYTRTVFSQPIKGHLNGDTAVRSYLECKTKFEAPPDLDDFGWSGSYRRSSYFDITEDDRIDDYTSETRPVVDDVSYLLYAPLPADLPTMNKDILILVAAYYGDIDRYSRLRRPVLIRTELDCIVRGIYHNTMFAKWWSLQPGKLPYLVEQAINARFIMSNDLSRMTSDTKALPYCIWYPSVPHSSTCRELFRRIPLMKPAISRVCILANYPETWDLLDPDPDMTLMADARESVNPKYLGDLQAKISSRGCPDRPRGWGTDSRTVTRHQMFEYSDTCVLNNVADNPCADIEVGVPYNGRGCNMSQIETSILIPDELKEIAREMWENKHEHIFLDKYYDSMGKQERPQYLMR